MTLADNGQFLRSDLPEAAVSVVERYVTHDALHVPVPPEEWRKILRHRLTTLHGPPQAPRETEPHPQWLRLEHMVHLATRGYRAMQQELAELGPVARWGADAPPMTEWSPAERASRGGPRPKPGRARDPRVPYVDAERRGLALREAMTRAQHAASAALFEAYWEACAQEEDPAAKEALLANWRDDVPYIEKALRAISGKVWQAGVIGIAYQEHLEQLGPTERTVLGAQVLGLTQRMRELNPLRFVPKHANRSTGKSEGEPADLAALRQIMEESPETIRNQSPKLWQFLEHTGIAVQVVSEGAGAAIKDWRQKGAALREAALVEAANPLSHAAHIHHRIRHWGEQMRPSVTGLVKLSARQYPSLEAHVFVELCKKNTPWAHPGEVLRHDAFLANPKGALDHFERARLLHTTARRLTEYGLALPADHAGRVDRSMISSASMNPFAADDDGWLHTMRAMAREVGEPEPPMVDETKVVQWRHAAAIAVGAMPRGERADRLLEDLEGGWLPGVFGTVPPLKDLEGMHGARWRARHHLDPSGVAFVRHAIEGAEGYDAVQAEFGHRLPKIPQDAMPTPTASTMHVRVGRPPKGLPDRTVAPKGPYRGPWKDGWWGTMAHHYIHRYAAGRVLANVPTAGRASERAAAPRSAYQVSLPFAPIAHHTNLLSYMADHVDQSSWEPIRRLLHEQPLDVISMDTPGMIEAPGTPSEPPAVHETARTHHRRTPTDNVIRHIGWSMPSGDSQSDTTPQYLTVGVFPSVTGAGVWLAGPVPPALALTLHPMLDPHTSPMIHYAPEEPALPAARPRMPWAGTAHALTTQEQRATVNQAAALTYLMQARTPPRALPRRPSPPVRPHD